MHEIVPTAWNRSRQTPLAVLWSRVQNRVGLGERSDLCCACEHACSTPWWAQLPDSCPEFAMHPSLCTRQLSPCLVWQPTEALSGPFAKAWACDSSCCSCCCSCCSIAELSKQLSAGTLTGVLSCSRQALYSNTQYDEHAMICLFCCVVAFRMFEDTMIPAIHLLY